VAATECVHGIIVKVRDGLTTKSVEMLTILGVAEWLTISVVERQFH
jgi:hypothetical protein